MDSGIVISRKAYKDIEHIRNWYDERSDTAGNRLLAELNIFILKAARNPEHYRKVNKNVRRCLLKIFPYTFYFSEQDGAVVILRVRHNKQRQLTRYT